MDGRPSVDHEAKIREWRAWVEVLIDEAGSLAHYRRIFRGIMEMIQANPDLPESSTIYAWLKKVYASAATITVRRLADEHVAGTSLYRLVGEIRGSSQVMTRTWFLSQHKDLPRDLANQTFDNFSPGGREFIDHEVLRIDQQRVKSAATVVTKFADKYVAHRAQEIALGKTLERVEVTWEQLDKAIDSVIEILCKYELLIVQYSLGDHVPTPQDDWRAVFKIAWLKE